MSRFYHWLMTFLLVILFITIFLMENKIGSKLFLLKTHIICGVTFLLLIFLRIFNKLKSASPPLDSTLPKWEKYLAEVTHRALYLLMILVPLSGFLFVQFKGNLSLIFDVDFLQILPKSPETAHPVKEFHETSAWIIGGLTLLHVAGVLFQQFIKKNKVMKKML